MQHHDSCTSLWEKDDYLHHARPDDPLACDYCTEFRAVEDAEARRAANDVEALPFLNDGRTVNRNNAIRAARRGLPR